MQTARVLKRIVWPDREWALNYMPRESPLEATATAERVIGKEKEAKRPGRSKRTRTRIVISGGRNRGKHR